MIIVHWWEDSSGRKTCHRNERGLTFSESLLGEVKGNDLDGWYYSENGELWVGPFRSVNEVQEKLMIAVSGALLTIWD